MIALKNRRIQRIETLFISNDCQFDCELQFFSLKYFISVYIRHVQKFLKCIFFKLFIQKILCNILYTMTNVKIKAEFREKFILHSVFLFINDIITITNNMKRFTYCFNFINYYQLIDKFCSEI